MTGSEFKFLRRVRIHDGECGAVARALHHAAQKVALVRNEQSLISDEKAFSRQADSKKAFGSTFNERKQMSTKTSIKRIALVAVSALGFGLLSVVPAKATTADSARVFASNNVSAFVGTQTSIALTLDAVGDTGEIVTVVPSVVSSPSTSAVTVGAAVAFSASRLAARPIIGAGAVRLYPGDNIAAGASTTVTDDDDSVAIANATNNVTVTVTDGGSTAGGRTAKVTLTKTSIGTLVFTPDVAGTYVLRLTADNAGTDNTTDITVTATLRTAPAILVGSTARQDRANDDTVMQVVTPSALGTAKLQFVNGPDDQSALVPGAVYTSASTGAIAGASVSGGAVNFTLNTDASGLTNGVYTFRGWEDILNPNVVDSNETATTLTVNVASDAKRVVFALSQNTVAVGGSAVSIAATFTAQDVDRTPSYVISGAPFSETYTDVNASSNTGITFSRTGGTVTIASSTAAGVYTIRIKNSTDTGNEYTSSQTLTVIKVNGEAATLSAKAATGLVFDTTYAGTAAGNETVGSSYAGTTAAATIKASTTDAKSITFNFTGGDYVAGAAKNVPVTVFVAPGTPITAVSAPSFALIQPDGTGTFTVTVAAPVADYAYRVSIPDVNNANGLNFTVTYAGNDPAFLSTSQTPAAAFTAKDLSTNVLGAILSDGFGKGLASKTVTITVSGRNPATTQVTTGADGSVSYSLVDAKAVATATTDTVKFSHAYIDGDGFAAAAEATFTITYNATGIVVGSVKVTYPANIGGSGTIAPRVDTVQQLGSPVDTADNTSPVVTYSASISDANGLPLRDVVVSWTADKDTKLSAATSVTNSTGVATIKASRNLIGFASVTATILGKSDTNSLLKWSTRDYNASGATASNVYRNVALTTDTPSVVAGSAIRYTAKVTDRWGNPVASVPLTLRLTGAGRLLTGEAASGANVVTATDGTFQWNVTSLSSETGTSTATVVISGGQTADLAGFVTTSATYPVAGVTAGNVSATATGTFTKDTSVSTADALLELAKAIGTGNSANAAADAALEAIDAANAATDAANLAAEAADAATVAAEEARDAADAATAAVEALASEVATLVAALKAQITTLANTVAKIAKRVKA